MRLRTAAMLGLLTVAFSHNTSAQAPPAPPDCRSPEVTLRPNKAVPAPDGFENAAKVAIYNTEESKEEVLLLRRTPPVPNPRPYFMPDASILETAQRLKEASTEAPEKFQLLWQNPANSTTCLQPFTVIFNAPQRILLNEAGIENRYVNPVGPVEIDGRPLQFVNDTGDRTFVVTIPFVYKGAEAATAYAIAAHDRGGNLGDIVCRAIAEFSACDFHGDIRELEDLRVLLEAVSNAAAVNLKEKCTAPVKDGNCLVEYFFWHATDKSDLDSDLVDLANGRGDDFALRKAAASAAGRFVDRVLTDGSFPSAADLNTATARQSLIASQAGSGKATPMALAQEAESAGVKSRFDAARNAIAKQVLITLIRDRMGFAAPKSRKPEGKVARYAQKLLKRPPVEGPGFPEEIQHALDRLDRLRKDLAKGERTEDNSAYYTCRRREVEAASKLLLSYSPNVAVPFSGIPESLLVIQGSERCLALKGIKKRATEQSQEEQGVEITGCASDGTNTTCSATATIPPYGRATFSRSMLEHHPGARIRFTASFFGDTEIPGNANGYVTRGDATAADEKPKRSFNLQLGGDTSISQDPDEAITGQLRHTTASGSLAFQFAGPVEASANIDFKSGDLGGESSQTTASQYQAKVYGPNRLVFQYGKISFAKPSSGIAINVFGEGMQVIAGPMSLAYVVLRESAAQKADRQNQDSSLWLFQLRNERFFSGRGPLRTYDLVGLIGNEKKGPSMDAPTQRAYHYWSAGGEGRFGTLRFPSLGASLAGYYSERTVDSSEPSMDPAALKDGKGWVGLGRLSWTHIPTPAWNEKQEAQPAYGVSGFLAYGSGDDKASFDEDDGYLGENAGYANDMIFLSRLANSKAFSQQLGKGLSNKTYFGLQLTSLKHSFLARLSKWIGAEKDIASRSTIFTVHKYWFNHDLEGKREAGYELNLAFTLEAPKNIQWVLSGAYYHTPPAIDRVVGRKDDLWMGLAKLSIKLDNL
jgi:hypothetical protein